QEEYFGQAPNSSEYFAFALVEQPDSLNFWYLSRDWDGANIGNQLILNKGSYNPATRQVDWNVVQTFTFNHFVLDGDVITPISPQLAFGPDGTVAYIGFLGDLAGGLDSVISPVLIESTDGGNTWGAPEEFDMSVFPEVYDSLAFYSLVLDSVFDMSGNFVRVDTVPFITHPTCAFDCDLEVDANGDPHLLAVVGGGASLNAPPAYSIFTFDYNLYDFTKDRFGDPNMLYVNDINTFRGYFGDITGTTSDYFAVDPYTQVSRSDDGNFIFYSWTDTDTTAPGYGPTPGPGTATQTNNAPDMYGRGLNVTAQKMTPTVDWTLTDTVWVGRAVMPKTANIAVRNGSVLTVPSIIINLNGASAIDAVSFWYFSNVNYDTDTDFIEDPVYFYNCKENPFTATNTTLTVVDAACGTGNGSATLATTGGIGPYTYAWSNGDQTPAITGQGAGVYTVTVTDSKGCTDVQTAVINNAGSAALTLNATASPSCFGLTDGSATVGVAGGTAPITYLWSNGETTASATQLPGGTSTLEATDANGCKSFLNVTLTPPSQITGLVAGTDILCNGDGNGTASVVSVSGGAGGYTYSWSNGANTQNITGLAGGTYTVTITDGNNCENDISIDVIEPDSISLQGSATDVTDCTFPDGTGSAAATGGTPPYTFNWSGPNGYTNSGTFVFGLDTGIYTIEVIDDNGCASTSTVTVAGCGFAIGIEDALNAGINTVDLYPNPNSGNFTLNVEMAEVSDLNITVLNVTGKQVYSLNASQVLNFKEGINIGNQPAGIYLLRLSTDKGATTMKFNLR
ncbi:MAG: T9SS type A sorting domain-containing protein, partial [Bacteroidota bacterium]